MTSPLRGVNLGGWLVLEKWITPSLFTGTKAVDEYTYCQQADAAGRRALRRHRDSFITESDFAWLAEKGIEAVRLPIGYWAFGDTQPYASTIDYVDKAFAWAARYNLKILIDVHGAPGSQNGEDHSGQQGPINWLQEQAHVIQTLQLIERLTTRYCNKTAWLGISLLNEPNRHLSHKKLRQFYKQAYGLVRQQRPDAWVIISDSFQPWRWYFSLPQRKYPGLYIDYHHYQLFTPQDKTITWKLHIRRAHNALKRKIARMTLFHPCVVGEWSLALPNQVLADQSSEQRNVIAKKYADAQLKSFQPLAAWFFWTYKTEANDLWSFERCATELLLPGISD